jgi:transaldolase
MTVTNLQRLYEEMGQSPWIDNLQRSYVRKGRLRELMDEGIRGSTSNPTIFQKAIEGSADYDDQFAGVVGTQGVEGAFWDLSIEDVTEALDVMRSLYDKSGGADGFVSIEVSPALAADTAQTIASARSLHERIARPNLLVKIPATREGVPAIREMIGEGRSINVTLIFGLTRYEEVIEAYLGGLEERAASGEDLGSVHSVASFFVSRVDTEVDRRLAAARDAGAQVDALLGQTAIAQAKLAYELFRSRFAGPRWEALAAKGARLQRPLWASTSTKNPSYPDLLYVDNLIGPDTVNTMPEATVRAFLDHGIIAGTVDERLDDAREVLNRLQEVGIDINDVARTLEDEGVASFEKSYEDVLGALSAKAEKLGVRTP